MSSAGNCDRRTKLLSVKPAMFGGWWANVHAFIKPLMYAHAAGLSMMSPFLPLWTDKTLCAHRSLACFFQPLSPCENYSQRGVLHLGSAAQAGSVHGSSGGKASTGTPQTTETLSLMQKVAEHRTNDGDSWVRRYSRQRTAERGSLHRRGWFWWVSALTSYVLRPSPRLAHEVADALNTTGLGAALADASRGPVAAMHVRHGDACKRDGPRSGRVCDPLDAYVAALKKLSAGVQVTTIYLATDSLDVLRRAPVAFPEYTWLAFEEALTYSLKANPQDRKWDAVLKSNRERSASGAQSGPNPNMRLATLTTIDVMLLAKCDLFVGKFSSNLFRTAYELHAAQCDCAAPFESLDHPWCFDWGVKVGGSGNVTFEC